VELPNDGEMTVYDHSWYGRVLVERCEHLIKKKLWRAAYEQMNELERWLTADGQVVIKFWLHISREEQRRRFRAYKRDPVLRAKVTKEYRRQHRRYARWLTAVEEMLQKTATTNAPWTVIEAHDLRWARVRVFETMIQKIEEMLEYRRRHPDAVSRNAQAIATLAWPKRSKSPQAPPRTPARRLVVAQGVARTGMGAALAGPGKARKSGRRAGDGSPASVTSAPVKKRSRSSVRTLESRASEPKTEALGAPAAPPAEVSPA
jgi:hypothetical protein